MGHSEQILSKDLDESFEQVVEQLQQFFVAVTTNFTHGRGTHTYGTAARGQAKIIVPPGFPENDFLTFGNSYPVVLRHATPGVEEDDRTLDGAATSIKFLADGDESGEGFHDVLMNTGNVLFQQTARNFRDMVTTVPDRSLPPDEIMADYVKRRKQLAVDGVVLDEKLSQAYRTGSFTEFYYHSQICFELNGEYYMRYRMIPADRGPERGLFPASVRADGRTTDPPWPDDERASDHMRRDFETLTRHLGVSYVLQAQLRPADVFADPWGSEEERERARQGVEPIALNASLYWNERYYPWLDVARIDLDEVLTEEEHDGLSYDANRTHESILLPLVTQPLAPADPRDPRPQADRWASFGHSRPLVYWLARKARAELQPPRNN